MRFAIAMVLASSFASVGCNIKLGTKKEKKKESYAYEYTVNGCATGRHEFGSVGALCAGLADESLNHGCAYSVRLEEAKQRGCPQVNGGMSAVGAGSKSSDPDSMDVMEHGQPGTGFRQKYEYRENGCTTGVHVVYSRALLCNVLDDDATNRNCARAVRMEEYQKYGCP